MQIIQNYVNSLPFSSKNILLFNYPSADMRDQKDENTYPRAADELSQVEENLGPVVALYNILQKKHQDNKINDPKEVKPVDDEDLEGEEGEEGGE